RAVVEAVQPEAQPGEQRAQPPLHEDQRAFGETAAGDARLVAHHGHAVAVIREPRQPADRARCQAHARRVHVPRNVGEERAVLVEKDGAGRSLCAHGQEVSRSGSTMISGMTVPAGCVRTNRTASATLAGSWRTSWSMSGKRSSRKGVRMPPAMSAVTLIP